MKHRFKYYMHDDYNGYERADFILGQVPDLDMDPDTFIQKFGRPFYEVTLVCELDDETGAVTLVEASL